MKAQELQLELQSTQEFFDRSTRCLTDADSGFRPVEGMYTVAQQVAHTAQTIDWFIQGGSRPEGFDLDFEAHHTAIANVHTLAEAREWLQRSFAAANDFFGSKTDEELYRLLPPGPVMAGAPVASLAGALIDHCAHHRGALTVYSRMLGKVPTMPYGG
ncbi:MAG: DinB family protein [Bryobacteraceae bacterium]|nr:DinB family protein [Bryobacteraceae bacterium]